MKPIIWKGPRDLAALEQRRLEAARLFAGGVRQAEVARRLGATATSVNRWYRTWQKEGAEGLKRKAPPGYKPRLSPEQWQQPRLGVAVGGTPPGGLRHRVVDRAPGAQTDLGALSGALSRKPCLAPAAQAGLELPEANQTRPRTGRGSDPALGQAALAPDQKGALKTGATLVFWDEAGFSQRPSVRRTWAPKGRTPVLRQPFNWKRLSSIGMIAYHPATGKGRVLFSLGPGNVASEWVLRGLRSLRRHLRGPVILLWDGLPAHRSTLTRRYLERQRHWLRVEPLPAYAPELNPVEALWANLSARELANLCPETLSELTLHVQRGVRRIRRHGDLTLAFLKHSGLFEELLL